MRMRWMLVAVLVMLCLTSHSSAQAASGPLQGLLNTTPDNDVSRTVIWYGSLRDLEHQLGITLKTYDDLNNLTEAQQMAYLGDIGNQVYYSGFLGVDHPIEWKQAYGIDTFSIQRELTVGAADKHYGILQGNFDTGAIKTALQSLGYKTSTVGGATVYSLGADNSSDPAHPALANFNRLVVSDKTITAAPSTPLIQAAVTGDKKIGADGGYTALATALEGSDTIPGTQLLSAALFNGSYLSDTVISADSSNNVKPLPRYEVAGIGYRRNATDRYWVIALVYAAANDAQNANTIISDGLPAYASSDQGGRKLFEGWKVASQVQGAADGKHSVVLVTMQLPGGQTDISWVKLIAARDVGFLATVH